jgi:hypothetical protein
MTLSGHIQSRTIGAYNQRVGNREEIFFNRQELNNKTGSASIRIYTFNITSMQVSVSTYALDTQTWLTDNFNQFSFPASLQAYSLFTDLGVWVVANWLIVTGAMTVAILAIIFVVRRRRSTRSKGSRYE